MHSGKNKRAVSLGLFLVILLSARGQEGKNFRYHLDGTLQTDHSVNEDGSFTIEYSAPEISISSLSNEHGKFYRLSVPGHMLSSDPGKPELPVYSKLIAIPDDSGYRIRITGVRSVKIKPSAKKISGILWPAQESEVKRELKQKPPFRIDRNVYGQKGIIKSDTVSIVPVGKVRNVRLANLCISPVMYNPESNSLEVIRSMKIEVTFDEPFPMTKGVTGSYLFSESLSKAVLNVSPQLINGYTEKPVGMIILTDTAFRKQIEPFIEWKTQKGFRIKVLYKGASMAGNTFTELKDTLEAIYNSANENDPAPDYLLIIGDVDRIPYYGMGGSGNITDMYYGEFDGGGDYIPDIYTGRIPAGDTGEVKSVLQKIIQYEKFDFADTNKFHKHAIATTGSDADHAVYMNGQVRYAVSNYLTPENRISENHFYYQHMDLAKQKDSILLLINKGTSFINYSGHGDATGWLHLDIKVADTALMKNRNMYPFVISNACRTSQFSLRNSFGNRIVVEKNRGAIGFIGCSNDSHWDEDFYWAVGAGVITSNPVYEGKGLGVFDRLFHTHNEYPAEWFHTMGQINYAGNLAVSSSTSLRKKYYWETYNVVGDPSIIPYIGEPEPFNVVLPDTLPNGITSLTLTVDPFSYIAISHFDSLWDASFAGVSGSVSLDIPATSDDSCLVVITGQNRYPLIKKIYFSDIQEEFINLNAAVINDILGNNNTRADYKENIYLAVTISNLGLTDAQDVYAAISSTSPFLTMVQDSVYIGTIPGSSSRITGDKLLIKIADEVPDMGIAPVDIKVKSLNSEKHYSVELDLHSPILRITSFIVDDTESGNGDFFADPGETFDLVFRIKNEGSSDATGQFGIQTENQEMTILEPNVKSGLLRFGETTDISAMVKLADSVLSGSNIGILSNLTCEPYIIEKNFNLRVGKIRESFEGRSFNIFPWINTSPAPWMITETDAAEGSLSARSGIIPHSGGISTLLIKTVYPAADSIKFYYKVSSEPNYDFLSFVLNGREVFRKSGESGWTRMAVAVPAGLNIMEWIYKKDGSQYGGADCAWIDLIDFAATGTVGYVAKDLFVARISEPVKKDFYGREILTVKVLNTGRDIINGFNLSYALENHLFPVKEHFDSQVLPNGDTVTVSFKTRVDLSRYGIYKINIYGSDNNDDFLMNDTVSLTIENTTIRETLNVFPNPFTDHINLFINSMQDDRVIITISNSAGILMHMTEKEITAGYNTVLLNDVQLIPGLYYLNIRGAYLNSTVPVLKLKE